MTDIDYVCFVNLDLSQMYIRREKAETVDWMMVIMVTSCTGGADMQKMRLENRQSGRDHACNISEWTKTVKPKRLFVVIVTSRKWRPGNVSSTFSCCQVSSLKSTIEQH